MPIEFCSGLVYIFIWLSTCVIYLAIYIPFLRATIRYLCLTSSFGEPLSQFHERFVSVRDFVLLFMVIGIHIERERERTERPVSYLFLLLHLCICLPLILEDRVPTCW